jgi:microcin C transport system substrate-binding protein
MSTRRFFFLALFLLAAHPANAAAPQPSLAMLGAPKYDATFTHFAYANPDAPQGGALKLGLVGTFDSLNPFIIRGKAPMGIETGVFSLVYESLMTRSWDEPFTLYGLIAESVEVPEDRASITFNLNPKAHWQDGKPITADDVLFSYQTLRDQGRPNHRTYYKKVAAAEKLSDRRVRFTFKPNADGTIDRELPLIMGLMPVLPKHDWEGRVFNETTLKIPVGSGPYKIANLNPGRSITYARDPYYWATDLPVVKGLYNFATIQIDYYRDDGAALQAFKGGAFDLRREGGPTKWATAYDTQAVTEGKIKLAAFPHESPEPARGFALNARRPLFADKVLRKAVAYAFDSAWIDRTLFHGLVKRAESFFPGSELATDATRPPEGEERAILEKYRAALPPEIFTESVASPSTTDEPESLRDNLLIAASLLKNAGYTLRNETLFTPQGALVSFEILLSDPADEKIALTWAHALKRLGIAATVRTVDSAQYQARLTSFDYDVTIAQWFNTLSPGNEQSAYWGSAAASQKGSRNYVGISDKIVDALATAIPASKTREDLVATTRALDRVLLEGAYVIPFFYRGADPIAYWQTRLDHPDHASLYGSILESWWARGGREAATGKNPLSN